MSFSSVEVPYLREIGRTQLHRLGGPSRLRPGLTDTDSESVSNCPSDPELLRLSAAQSSMYFVALRLLSINNRLTSRLIQEKHKT